MMKPGTYLFDGAKSISLSSPSAWLTGEENDDSTLSPVRAYGLVPYLYRGIDLRARALSGLPWTLTRERDGADVQRDPAYRGLVQGMRMRLYLTEAALCLYGAAYWLKETNRIGRNLTPRWVVPTSVQPMYSPERGLDSFQRVVSQGSAGAGQVQSLDVGNVCYFWLPNLGAEVGPGISPAQVALAAAGVLHNLDQFTEGFFRRGAVKLTLLTVEGNPPRDELDRLELWWRRVVAGVRQAWRSVAIRSSVKPVVIGDGLSDTVNDTLTTQRREDVCAALGVPHSLISADAANYATSQQDTLNFYQQTIVPEALLVEEVMNDQLLANMGLRWHFQPERLEVFQEAEMRKAAAVARLVGKPIMTVDEGRAWMGLPPLEGAELKTAQGSEAAQRGAAVQGGNVQQLEALGLVSHRPTAGGRQ